MVPVLKIKETSVETILERTSRPTGVEDSVKEIIEHVKAEGDKALREYSLKFDKAELKEIELSREEWDRAADSVDPEIKEALMKAAARIKRYHQAQKRESFVLQEEGITLCSV